MSKKLILLSLIKYKIDVAHYQYELLLLQKERIKREAKSIHRKLHFINKFNTTDPPNHRRDFFFLNTTLLTSFDSTHGYL